MPRAVLFKNLKFKQFGVHCRRLVVWLHVALGVSMQIREHQVLCFTFRCCGPAWGAFPIRSPSSNFPTLDSSDSGCCHTGTAHA